MVKIRYTTETVCQRISPEIAQQNFVKRCSYEEHGVFGATPCLNLDIWPKIKYTTDIVCQRNFSEISEQNFMKLCSYERNTLYSYLQEFLGVTSLLNLLLKQFVIASPLNCKYAYYNYLLINVCNLVT